ncbi:putative solute-binding protein [Agitococcus lubricus]|uniref:TRAP-type C4-dicarboxylate transport system substrate-binding protein n=1 Tax=Agitococcus lubricus TaxID=1077255 RepID=A0A2T5J103_9GAMM|nr:putative solute-binding protein [Agitococcus lubricus]PTQ90014.1 hypothetical protein C8N29_10452 [Agitococcus lubricus]
MFGRLLRVLSVYVLSSYSVFSYGQSLCVFDVLGVQGPFYGAMREYATQANKWQVTLELRAYKDEQQLYDDYQQGHCDAALMTGIRVRDFNLFSSSIEAIGAIQNYPQLRATIDTLSRPEAAKLLSGDGHEVGGILPVGSVFLFLNDRAINSVDKLRGKKVAVLDHDIVQIKLAERLGFQALASDIQHFASKFNEGITDLAVSPALAYLPLELYQGVGNKGLVLNMPIAQLSLQVLLKQDKFPTGFGQQSRRYFASQFEQFLKPIIKAEEEILYFFPAPDGEYENYQQLLRNARISLTADGIYDKKMMALLKKIRCQQAPQTNECADTQE